MTAAKLRLAMAVMGQPETKVSDLCEELGITRQTLYRHVSPNGQLRLDGTKLAFPSRSKLPFTLPTLPTAFVLRCDQTED